MLKRKKDYTIGITRPR